MDLPAFLVRAAVADADGGPHRLAKAQPARVALGKAHPERGAHLDARIAFRHAARTTAVHLEAFAAVDDERDRQDERALLIRAAVGGQAHRRDARARSQRGFSAAGAGAAASSTGPRRVMADFAGHPSARDRARRRRRAVAQRTGPAPRRTDTSTGWQNAVSPLHRRAAWNPSACPP